MGMLPGVSDVTEPGYLTPAGLLHTITGGPGALEFADVEDLARVVCVMRTDVRKCRSPLGQLCVGSVLGEGFDLRHDRVEVVDGTGPGRGVEVVEGFFVVAGELGSGLAGGLVGVFALELGEGAGVPEPEVESEHAGGVVGVGVELAGGVGGDPLGLLGGEAGDGSVDGREPLSLVVGGVEFAKQGAAEGGGYSGFGGGLGEARDSGQS